MFLAVPCAAKNFSEVFLKKMRKIYGKEMHGASY